MQQRAMSVGDVLIAQCLMLCQVGVELLEKPVQHLQLPLEHVVAGVQPRCQRRVEPLTCGNVALLHRKRDGLPGGDDRQRIADDGEGRTEEHTSELQSLMRISYAVFCLKKKKDKQKHNHEQSYDTNKQQ